MSLLLYTLGVRLYTFGIYIVAFFSPKAKLWVAGRKDIWSQLSSALEANSAPIIWMHCASLGEFEQGRPVLEAIRQQQPTKKILLTFFSPSGYEIRKDYEGADWVFYLPPDSAHNAKQFLKLVQPTLAIFVKYEFWYYYLNQLHRSKIKTILISAHFRPNQVFFRWYGGLFRRILSYFDHIFVQNQTSLALLSPLQLPAVVVAGDTRLDRVLTIKNAAKTFPYIEQFCQNAPVLVCGSTWVEDELILIELFEKELIPKGWKIIVAPHHIDQKHLAQVEKLFAPFSYAKYSNHNTENIDILIIDNIGMLSSLYSYADLAYIGGGFGAGIHNILEAVVYEIPVLFGPQHKKFAEAQELKKLGIGLSISNATELIKQFQATSQSDKLITIQQQAQHYIEQHKGATTTILKYILD